MDSFQAATYICKFYFLKFDYACISKYRQKISADLYLKELKIEIIDESNDIVAVYGYSLENKMKALLPLLRWDEFEKTRERSGFQQEHNGYRDGWGYEFKCMNESGKSLITNYLDTTFTENNKPAYELLFDWIIENYSKKKVLKNYKLAW